MTDSPSGDTERIIDYRSESDSRCDICGAPTKITEARGTVYLTRPSELARHAQYGATEPGAYTTIWNQWVCTADDHHWGPLLRS